MSKEIEPSAIEQTSTISFKEELSSTGLNPISGLATLVGDGNFGSIWFYVSWVIAIIVIISIILTILKNAKIKKWKKHEDCKGIFILGISIKKALKNKEIEDARDDYKEIKKLYPSTPEDFKVYIYKRIKKLQIEIDKKDMKNLFKEFIQATKEDRKQDAINIYKDMKLIYHRMPDSIKEKFYEKVIPYIKRFNRN